jgi:L-ascorbate metabolism protein UlaG (beta-lactamase superfamily)
MRVSQRIIEQRVPRGSVAVWWLGQNSYVLRAEGVCIMLDPFFSRPGPADKYLHAEAPLAADELRPDAVFCTHNHSDHTDPGFLGPLSHSSPNTLFFGPPESAEAMRNAGIDGQRVAALASGETVEVADARVEVFLSKTPEVSDVAHYGYVLDLGGAKIYNTGDIMRGVTREPALMDPLRRAAPDVALITTSPTEEEFPDFGEAAALAAAVGARVAVPAHYHCFSRRTYDPQGFAEAVGSVGGLQVEIIPYCGCYVYSR